MVVRHQPARVITERTANGLLSFDTRDQTIGRALFIRREYETDVMGAVLAVLRRDGYLPGRPAACVIDAGANIGTTCVALLAANEFRSAVAIEPDAANFALLERNVAQNGLAGRVRCLRVALDANEGARQLVRSADNWGGHHLGAQAVGDHGATSTPSTAVPTITLDQLIAGDPRLGAADAVSLLWLDVEGYEGWCLKGATQLVQRGVPVVAEFWAGGIERAEMGRSAYTKLLADAFTHFYHGPDHEDPFRPFARYPIADVGRLFDDYPRTRERTIILINSDRARSQPEDRAGEE